jgi:hypothetical protein
MGGFADSMDGFLFMLGIVYNKLSEYLSLCRHSWFIWQTFVLASSLDLTIKQTLVIFDLCHICRQSVGNVNVATDL